MCEVEDCVKPQDLDGYEAEAQFTLEYVEPDHAIFVNRKNIGHDPKELEREARVLEILKQEGYV